MVFRSYKEINYIVLCSGSADRGIATNTRISSDRNSNKKISVNKNPPYQVIHSIQTNTFYENVQQTTTPDETLM